MLALPKLAANLAVPDQLKSASFDGRIAAAVRFPDEIEPLEQAGASTVFNAEPDPIGRCNRHAERGFPHAVSDVPGGQERVSRIVSQRKAVQAWVFRRRPNFGSYPPV